MLSDPLPVPLGARMDLRAAIRLPVSCPVVLTAGCLEGRGCLINLSVWGCAMRAPVGVRRGDRCTVALLMPDEDAPLLIQLARVRWSTGRECGVEFLNMTAPARSRLRRFLLALRAASPC